MKVTVNESRNLELEGVFNPVILKTNDGEKMAICMRDSGFEFEYQGKKYFAKEGFVEPFQYSERGNELVEQRHRNDVDVAQVPSAG
ncbi:MAG: hypothetical protein GY749_30920 [Desulfobacteraceae bacterium]|nr:hypothetical protein [Desulfobacteraceae bacterium]